MSGPQPIRLLIADDHPVVRDGLGMLLDLEADVQVVGLATDGAEAVEMALKSHPDVVLMDLRMPVLSGIEAMRRILDQDPSIRFVVLTTYVDDDEIGEAFRAGALGYLTKDASRPEIHDAVLAAAAGTGVLSQEAQRSLARAAKRPPPGTGPVAAAEVLTPREQEVLRLIAAGRSNREIMKQLRIGEATIKTHINRIFAKTGVRDRAQAVRYAYQHGLASVHDG
ncbi:response regulator transcription factor [Actinoplanes sp. KI2]|uniref:response regulator n=1 Tax=Actinoplanes sp. KI2 TaxID=2983315 RepID=UPI0021D5AE66|nr:response regulator transcription factor [Actinoplanes sp. KI2]MCU7728479.1 response regulator transcription factor [Actinoplanes sp. KI2]